MYYFYETLQQNGLYLHRTKRKEVAEKYGIIAVAPSLEESQDKFVELIQNGNYINKRDGQITIRIRERRGVNNNRNKVPVKCVETGEEWESMSALAKSLKLTKQNISYQIKNNKAVGKKGYHYIKVKED